MPKRLAILVGALAAFGCNEPDAPPPESGAADPPAQLPPDPFGPSPRHPPEVVRLMNLLPGIPADGSFEDIIRYLGRQAENVRSGFCAGGYEDFWWDLGPGYRFYLSFSRPGPELVFAEAGVQVRWPGGGVRDYRYLYPVRSREGMIAK
jgi:hypothetical protein